MSELEARRGAIICAPRHPQRAIGLIAGMPLLLSCGLIGRLWLDQALFDGPQALSVTMVSAVFGLLCTMWLVPAYMMARAMLTQITVSEAGIRRSGVPGATLFIPWGAVQKMERRATLEGASALLIQSPGGRIALSDEGHERGAEAIALIERVARSRGLPIEEGPARPRLLS